MYYKVQVSTVFLHKDHKRWHTVVFCNTSIFSPSVQVHRLQAHNEAAGITSQTAALIHMVQTAALIHMVQAAALIHMIQAAALIHMVQAAALIHMVQAAALIHMVQVAALIHMVQTASRIFPTNFKFFPICPKRSHRTMFTDYAPGS